MSVYSIEDLENKESSLKEGQVEQGGKAPASEPAKGEEGGKPIDDNGAQEAPKAEESPVTSEPSSQIDIEKLIEEKINKLKESGEIVDKDTYEQQVKDLKLNREAIEKELKRNLEVDLDNVSASKNLLIESLMEAEGISRNLAEMQVERNYPNLFDETADEEDRNYTFDKEKFKHDVNKILNNKKTKLEELLSKTTDVANVEE